VWIEYIYELMDFFNGCMVFGIVVVFGEIDMLIDVDVMYDCSLYFLVVFCLLGVELD